MVSMGVERTGVDHKNKWPEENRSRIEIQKVRNTVDISAGTAVGIVWGRLLYHM